MQANIFELILILFQVEKARGHERFIFLFILKVFLKNYQKFLFFSLLN
jgi:hypothetical protein